MPARRALVTLRTMRFGLFVPQGWRLDLAGIDPARAVGGDARRRQARRRGAVGVGVGLRPLPHRAAAHRRGLSRGVDADGRARRGDRAGPARPDVHLHELPQPGLPREGRRHLRHRVRRARRDGHRRRLVRARVARLRLRLPVRRGAAGHARRGRADHAPGLDGRPRHAERQALPGRRRDRPAAAPAGGRHPAVDRRRRGEGDAQDRGEVRAVHELRRHAARASPASPSCSPGTAATSAPTSTRSSARPTTTSRSAPPRPRSKTGCSSSRPG